MNNELVMKYILSQNIIEMPALQKKFDLTYLEAKTVVDFMLNGKMLEYASGVAYSVIAKKPVSAKDRELILEDDPEKKFYKRALWECVKRGTASISVLQRELRTGFNRAGRAIEWMEQNGYVLPLPTRTVLMTEKEYERKFGDPNCPLKSYDELYVESFDGQQEDGLKKLRASLLNVYSPKDEEEDEDTELIELDELEDDDDDTEEFNLEEIQKRLGLLFDVDKEEDDDNGIAESEDDDSYRIKQFLKSIEDEKKRLFVSGNIKQMLIECLSLGLKEQGGTDRYVLEIDDENVFEFKFVDNGNLLRISDGGRTLAKTSQSNRKIINLLKSFAQVSLDGVEIVVTVDSPENLLKAILNLYAAVGAVKKTNK